LTASKNGVEFTDYVRLLAWCGAREQETIKLRWADVDFEHKLLTIGAEGDTKNREARRVDFNAGIYWLRREFREQFAPLEMEAGIDRQGQAEANWPGENTL
jgi:integrase